MVGKLIVAGFAIGNRSDVPARTIQALSAVNYIVTEPTDDSQYLFETLGCDVNAEIIEYFPWFENGTNKNQYVIDDVVSKVIAGNDVLLLATEGMPLIHDPGYEIVLEFRKKNLPITVIPGPTAPIAALAVSGLDCWKFSFESDMPYDIEEKGKVLADVKKSDKTLIFFEKNDNLINTLDLANKIISPQRPACVCINLTRSDERILRGTLAELLDWFNSNYSHDKLDYQQRIVLLISGTNYHGSHLEK